MVDEMAEATLAGEEPFAPPVISDRREPLARLIIGPMIIPVFMSIWEAIGQLTESWIYGKLNASAI